MSLEYFERGAAAIHKNYSADNVAPHTTTVRWIYTVPTGKYAMLEEQGGIVMRKSAPTTPGRVDAYIRKSSDGAAVYPLYMFLLSGTVGDKVYQNTGRAGVLFPGAVVSGETVDISTGGTCDYVLGVRFTEFS